MTHLYTYLKMEFLHGVFLYEIAKYCQLESIVLVEMFSSTI